MADETPTTETQTQETTPPEGGEAGGESGKVRGLISEAKRYKDELAARDQEIASIKAQIAADKEAADKKRLEEEGNYKTLAEKAEARTKALEIEHAKTLKKMSLETALLQAGIVDPFRRAGMIAACPEDTDTETHVAQLQKDYPDAFKPAEMSPAAKPAQGGKSSSGSSTGVEQAKALMQKAKDNPGSVTPAELEDADKILAAWEKSQIGINA
jgi:hypothetical protein